MLDGGAIYSEDILRTLQFSKFEKEICSNKENLVFLACEVIIPSRASINVSNHDSPLPLRLGKPASTQSLSFPILPPI